MRYQLLITATGLVFLLSIIKLAMKKKKLSEKIKKLLAKGEDFLGWNFILMVILASNLKFSLYIALNLAAPDFRTPFGIICFISSVDFAALSPLFLKFLIQGLLKYHAANKRNKQELYTISNSSESEFTRKYKILVEDYKAERIWQLIYVPLL